MAARTGGSKRELRNHSAAARTACAPPDRWSVVFSAGLPTELPVAVLDRDTTDLSRRDQTSPTAWSVPSACPCAPELVSSAPAHLAPKHEREPARAGGAQRLPALARSQATMPLMPGRRPSCAVIGL